MLQAIARPHSVEQAEEVERLAQTSPYTVTSLWCWLFVVRCSVDRGARLLLPWSRVEPMSELDAWPVTHVVGIIARRCWSHCSLCYLTLGRWKRPVRRALRSLAVILILTGMTIQPKLRTP